MAEKWIKTSDELPDISGKNNRLLVGRLSDDSDSPDYKLMYFIKDTDGSYNFLSLDGFDLYSTSDVEYWKYLDILEKDESFYDKSKISEVELKNEKDLSKLSINGLVRLKIYKEFIDYLLELKNESFNEYLKLLDVNFRYKGNLSEVIFEEGVTIIPERIFMNTAVSSISLPTTLKYIQNSAFNSCGCLKSVDFPEDIEVIDVAAFERTNISRLKLPENLKYLGSAAFGFCRKLSEVDFSKYKLSYIPSSCFYFCESLESIDIPSTVELIQSEAFAGCSSLKKLSLSDSVKIIEDYAFNDCLKLKELKIPENVVSIGDSMLQGCEAIKEVTLPIALGKLGDFCFQDCKNLKRVIIPDNIKSLYFNSPNLFIGCSNLEEVICSKELYNSVPDYLDIKRKFKF